MLSFFFSRALSALEPSCRLVSALLERPADPPSPSPLSPLLLPTLTLSLLPSLYKQTAARSFLTRLSSPKIAFDIFHGDLHKRYWKYPFQVWGDVRNKRF